MSALVALSSRSALRSSDKAAGHAFDEPSLGLDYSFIEESLGISASDLQYTVERALLSGPPANLEAVGLGTRTLRDHAAEYRRGRTCSTSTPAPGHLPPVEPRRVGVSR